MIPAAPAKTSAEDVEVVGDEYALIARMVPLAGARVLDLGCGDAAISRRISADAGAASVVAVDSDEAQLALNRASPASPRLHFERGVAEAIPCPDASFELVLMLKSLHHVPVVRMDDAFREIRRVLAPAGLLYISEPVFDGDFNDVMRLFHDEQHVRQCAIDAMRRAIDAGLFAEIEEKHFVAPIVFRDFADFEARTMNTTHTRLDVSAEVRERVRQAFMRNATAEGVRFVRPMRVNLLRKVS